MKTAHLLIMRFSAMGDVAMMVPIVKTLARQYPELRITVLSRPFAKAFFENLSPNVSFMGADVKNEYKHISGLNELYRRLSAKHFTAVADFHGVLRTEYLRSRFRIDGVKVAHIDKHRKGRKKLCRFNKKELVQQPTPFQNYADVLDKLGFNITLDKKDIPIHYAQEGQLKASDEKWIGVAPIAAFKGKTYPLEKMKNVIVLLLQKYPSSRIYIFGAKPDEVSEVIPEQYSDSKQIINVSDVAKGFDKELQLMNKLDVMISMDSANMHFASLVGLPVVSIWGQTHPYAGFMGWGQSEDNAVQIDLPCRPCSIFGNKECAYIDYPCMHNISPELIVEKVSRIVE